MGDLCWQSNLVGKCSNALVRVAFRGGKRRRHPGYQNFRGSMAGLRAPLPTLRRYPRGCRRTARGRCGSLLLHRSGLSPPTPCRSPGALPRFLVLSLIGASSEVQAFVWQMPMPRTYPDFLGRHHFQNPRVRRTRTVRISRRPRSIATHNSSFAESGSTA